MMHSIRKFSFLRWAILLLGSLLFFSCHSEDDRNTAQGVFEADEVTVSSEVSGKVIDLYIKEGDKIVAKHLVGLIDTTHLALQRSYIEAQLTTMTDAGYTNVPLRTEAIKKEIEALQKEKLRISQLVAEEIIARKELDQIADRIGVLQAQLRSSQDAASQQNKSTSGSIQALEVQKRQIQERIKQCYLASPISGTVLEVYVLRGELSCEGRPLFKVADLDNIKIRCYLTAEQLYGLAVGDPVEVWSDMGEENPPHLEGKVAHIANKAEFTPKNIQSKEERSSLVYAVEVTVPNNGNLRIGQYGKIAWKPRK